MSKQKKNQKNFQHYTTAHRDLPASIGIVMEVRDELITKIDSLEFKMESRFDNVQSQFGGIQSRFDNVQSQFGGIQSRFDNVQSQFGGIQSKFDSVQSQFNEIKSTLSAIQAQCHRTGVLVEEQRNENKIALEGVQLALQQNKLLTKRVDDHDDLLKTLVRTKTLRSST